MKDPVSKYKVLQEFEGYHGYIYRIVRIKWFERDSKGIRDIKSIGGEKIFSGSHDLESNIVCQFLEGFRPFY